MARFFPALALAALMAVCGWKSHVAAASEASSRPDDASRIYSEFLDHWHGSGRGTLNVSRIAEAPTKEEIDDFTNCASNANGLKPEWEHAANTNDLEGAIGTLAYVRLVNPEQWHPTDPEDLMSKGQSVESAVDAGFAGGLMTLSTIVFDRSHETAAMTYSFVCGSLCGNGGSVIFRKTPAGWVQIENVCGTWIS
jgi:hypothetical protein